MCTTLTTLDGITNTIGSGSSIYKKIENHNNSRAKEQIALDNAKFMQEETKYQKQLGIEEARLKKILVR